MKTSKIFNLICQLPKEKLLSLFTKLFERNIISMMFLKEAHERSGYLLRHVEAYQDFSDKISSGSEGLSEKTSLRILSYLFFISPFDGGKIFKKDYTIKDDYSPTYGEISFLNGYLFPFFNQTDKLPTNYLVFEMLEVFEKANKIIKVYPQSYISKSCFYKIKTLFIKYLITKNFLSYNWRIETKEDTGETFIAIIFHSAIDVVFHQKIESLKDVLLEKSFETKPEVYKNNLKETENNYTEEDARQAIALVNICYYKILKDFILFGMATVD